MKNRFPPAGTYVVTNFSTYVVMYFRTNGAAYVVTYVRTWERPGRRANTGVRLRGRPRARSRGRAQ